MRDISLCFVGSTREIIERTLVVAKRLELDILTLEAGLEEAIHHGQRLESEGVEVFVSRRGTAHLLREKLAVPVLSLPDSSLNILKALKEASVRSKRILLTSFQGRFQETSLMEDLLGVTILKAPYRDGQSLEQAVIQGKAQGCGVVIGGGVSAALARSHGLEYVVVHTSEESIASALEDARNVARSRRDERERALRYRTILDNVSEGILAVDNNGRITTVNQAAKNALKLPQTGNRGKKVSAVLNASHILEAVRAGRPIINHLEKIGREEYIMNHIPILSGAEVMGAVSTFHDISSVMLAENEVRRSIAKGFTAKYRLEDFIHQSQAARDMLAKVRRYAAADSTLLITGETGTGKEIIANGVHLASSRRRGPFVSINCSALPDQLLESELFGHEEGAFTGSRRGGKPGLFEIAHQGTIFLDEIGTTPMSVQTRLLRVLQEREVMRIGGERVIPVNVRVVAATNRTLSEEVRQGRLREDLFFRLNVLTVTISPLRDRPEDIALLAAGALMRATARHGREPFAIPATCLDGLKRLPWPGNVRQLENFIERLALLCENGFNRTVFDEIVAEIRDYSHDRCEAPIPVLDGIDPDPHQEVLELEERQVRRALNEAGQSRVKAARLLGVSRTTLWRKLRRLGLEGAESGM